MYHLLASRWYSGASITVRFRALMIRTKNPGMSGIIRDICVLYIREPGDSPQAPTTLQIMPTKIKY